jgi:hypothetical protein
MQQLLSQHADFFMPRDTVRAVVEDVRQSDGVACCVTREHVRSADIRTRYRLAAAGESWKIVGIDRECFLCRGTGQSSDGDTSGSEAKSCFARIPGGLRLPRVVESAEMSSETFGAQASTFPNRVNR